MTRFARADPRCIRKSDLRERKPCAGPAIAIDWWRMTDPNEIRALKASLRGVLDAAAAVAALQDKVEALDERGDIAPEELDALAAAASGNAVAGAALRGLVGTMQTRRGAAAS